MGGLCFIHRARFYLMADFCHQCSLDLFDKDYEDLKGICDPGFIVSAICEGCGFIHVDHLGRCMGGKYGCLENHPNPNNETENQNPESR